MASFDSLKDLIRSVIYENEDQAITGEVMQNTLLEMVRSLGTGYKYIGIADATTDPGTPDENVFYFATAAGTYTYFGNLTVAANEIAILKGSGSSWSKDVTSIASTGALQTLNAALEQLGQSLNSVASRVSTAEGQILTLNQIVSLLDQKLEKQAIPILATKKYVNLSGGVGTAVPAPTSAGAEWKCYKVNVSEGDIVIVNGTGGSGPRLWGFADSEDIILSVAVVNASATGLVLIAPENAAYVIINDKTDSTSYYALQDSVPAELNKVRSEFAAADAALNQKLIKLVGKGGSPVEAGASAGDIFYNTVTKLLRLYNGGNSFTTIPYRDGAIYTMYGDLYIWNGTDLVLADAEKVAKLSSIETDVNGILNVVYDPVVTYDSDDVTAGYFDLTGTTPTVGANASWRKFKKPVHKGDIVTVYTKGGINGRAYALTNTDDTIITVAGSNLNTLADGVILSVAVDGYLYVNCAAGNISDFKVEMQTTRINTTPVVTAPCMFNPKADLKKQNLRILDIGNSYTNDATHYLSDIIAAAGITATGYSHYNAIRGGASFKTWVDCFNDQDTQTYSIGRVSGDVISEVEVGTGEIGDGALFRTALAAGWDLILIHQVSNYANDYDAWQGQGAGGYLKELIRIIRASNPNAAIGFVLVHSYTGGYSQNSEGSSLLRWQNIALSAKKLVANYGVDFIIPYGTAVQNLRASSINVDKNDFSNDGTHLADGIGDYVAGACYFQMIYAPRFDKNIIGNTFRKTDLDETETGVLNINNTTAPLAQKAAFAAAYDWYNINNPDNL